MVRLGFIAMQSFNTHLNVKEKLQALNEAIIILVPGIAWS